MVSKVTYNLKLPLKEIDQDLRNEVKDEVGTFIVEAILEKVGGQVSPVTGRTFKKLSKNYASYKAKESSSPVANLELTGSMLDALTYEVKRDGVEVGIFDELEAQKADNHNKFSSASKKTSVPPRKFIPNAKEDETFTKNIKEGIAEILSEYSTKSKSYFKGEL